MANHTRGLDTTIEIVTPENIAFRYQVAGPMRRLPAYLIDLAVRVGIGIVAQFVLMFVFAIVDMPGVGIGIVLTFWFFIAWFYGGLFETFWNGQTPGKRLMQIRVLSVDGQPVNGLQAVLRNLLRAVDSQPFLFYQVGLFAAMTNDRFQRLGDLACGTMVVVEERHWFRGVIRIDEAVARDLVGEIPADFQASRTLGRALAAYVARRQGFPWVRRMEIARHLGEPLRDRFGLPPDTDLDQLLCAVYHRTFITDRDDGGVFGDSPFAEERSWGSPVAAAMATADTGGGPPSENATETPRPWSASPEGDG